ncbi:NUDIX hydrolase [Fertoeibacter niger]|uniref:NUDIX hydrolase n=1 Tax=Fertoeibacter niger TaxID=2656921 RepID=UPI0030B9CC74
MPLPETGQNTDQPQGSAGLPIRPAATVILLRQGRAEPEVLMGQRGAAAAFMPSKFVFPGGAVDAGDAAVPLARPLSAPCAARLGEDPAPAALAAAAIRELWEETGLALGRPGHWHAPEGWQDFAARGLQPDAAALRFVFRAITPPGRTRRFDARFFLADAAAVAGDTNDFSAASDELSHLHWIGLAAARALDLPFITEVVLSEITALLRDGPSAAGVPFFDNSGTTPQFRRLA